MGLFDWFGSGGSSEKKDENLIPWQPLTSMEQLDEIVQASKTKPVAIFKHSTRCGISSMALRHFENSYEIDPDHMDLYFLDLLSYRSLSDEVGYRFQVMHQSPQLIVIKNGVAVHHASHHGIQASGLEKHL